MSEIKPCPFCGGESFENATDPKSWNECVQYGCPDCGATVEGYTEEECVVEWNTRHHQWSTDIDAAPRDGTPIDVIYGIPSIITGRIVKEERHIDCIWTDEGWQLPNGVFLSTEWITHWQRPQLPERD